MIKYTLLHDRAIFPTINFTRRYNTVYMAKQRHSRDSALLFTMIVCANSWNENVVHTIIKRFSKLFTWYKICFTWCKNTVHVIPQNCKRGSMRNKSSSHELGTCYLAQNTFPQSLQWWRLSINVVNLMPQPEHRSANSSFTQWSAIRPASEYGFYVIDQARVQDGGILAKFFFVRLWTETKSRSINMQNQKRTTSVHRHLDETSCDNKAVTMWFY